MRRYALGIDIGGTFTDIVVYDTIGGRQLARKVLTTHQDPAEGVMAGIDQILREDGVDAADIGRIVHATTLFTNALIERKGAVTGLITTAGFRDVLEIGRERKYELYDINIRKPEPLVPRHLRREVEGRMLVDGSERTPLDAEGLLREIDALVAADVRSVAIVFLHAYVNPAHEREAERIVSARHPALSISISSEIAPEIREYERTSTTVCNAYVKPLAARYLDAMSERIAQRGTEAPFLLMLSNGGLTSTREAKRAPVQLLESGPAAGALAGAYFGAPDGGRHVLAFDMGGTTAKLSVIEHGKPHVAYAFEAARQKRFIEGSGLPVRISTLELIEIGAGGGSIAHVDEIGLLKVGPQSAGSEPGPAAYGRGGTLPTVTDADFLLGYLNPAFFAGGSMPIDLDAVTRAMTPLAARTGLSVTELAWGMHDVVNENMANAARVHIAERGKDPRSFALLSTGGAGPVHAYYLARKLGLKRVICPRGAGVASALGLLVAPARVDRVATVAREIGELDWVRFEELFQTLERSALAVIAGTGMAPEAALVRRIADIRYVGQAFELVVDLPAGPYSAASEPALAAAFEASYLASFTRMPPSTPVEIINIRVAVTAEVPGSSLALGAPAPSGTALKGERSIYFPEWREHRPVAVYDRYALSAGMRLLGPAVVEERESTLVIGPGGRFEVAPSGNIIVEIG